jgi:hypothetical protein
MRDKDIEYVKYKTEQFDDFDLVEDVTAIYYMSTIGFNYLFLCTMV